MVPSVADTKKCGLHLLETQESGAARLLSAVPGTEMRGIIKRSDGLYPQHTHHAPLPVGEGVGILFVERNMPLWLSSFVFPYTISAELVLVLNFSLKWPRPQGPLLDKAW